MAKLPALVKALAEVDGRERKAVDHIARLIRERGYIPTGKRGSGAAEMTSREAANLIIALCGADTPNDTPIAIDRFRSLRQTMAGNAKAFREYEEILKDLPRPVQEAAEANTFGSALEALIDGVPELLEVFRQYSHDAFPDIDHRQLDEQLAGMLRARWFGLKVTFHRYRATIELFRMGGTVEAPTTDTQLKLNFEPDRDRIMSGFYGQDWPDREVSVSIATTTLVAAWQAIRNEQPSSPTS